MSTEQSPWHAYTWHDGKTFYYNAYTDTSTWEKPAEWRTREERDRISPWEEFRTKANVRYYYNVDTKARVWEIPPEERELFARTQKLKRQVSNPLIPINGAFRFTNRAQSERALLSVFRERDVPVTWTFDDVMREFINHPVYKAVATAGEKKQIFLKYIEEKKAELEEAYKETFFRDAHEFRQLINSTPGVSLDSPWQQIVQVLGLHPTFRAVQPEEARETIFEEMRQEREMRRQEAQEAIRKRNFEKLHAILRRHNVAADCLYADARRIWEADAEYISDKVLNDMSKLNLLLAFERYVEILDSEEEDLRKRSAEEKATESLENFKKLIDSNFCDGKLPLHTKWQQFFNIVRNQAEFVAVLDLPTSLVLGVFFDKIAALRDEKV